ncbi:sulfite oxidase [Deinococcus sp. Marseille-Q6407]|uniref:sulfite oxidase n=1 Tax=Deinococcus sp. Marseille-Q6407 TaxID=2969223 RepID=UPI0021C02B88|nr:sulfite oxidase [Deinococcus sp. Marseille-Q6407]
MPPSAAPGRITRQNNPDNLETPFASLDGEVTSTQQHYVRSHFAVPKLDPGTFSLKVAGLVGHELSLSLADLRALPQETRRVTLECAGNGRVYLPQKTSGVQWELGAVSTADWTGVPLRAVLELAGVQPQALEVVLQGADRGTMDDPLPSGGDIHYARSLPLAKAQDDVLLAYEMNGQPLPACHGFPLRAVVPGWYGMAAVKWLNRIELLDRPYGGYFQTVDYARWEPRGDLPPERVPLGPLHIKAQIASPAPYQALPLGQLCRITGAAWCGEGHPAAAEVSTDGGQTWQPVRWTTPAQPGLWRLWAFDWTPAEAGPAELLVRATSSTGETQPQTHDPGRGSYEITHPVAVPVTVVPRA